MRLRLLPQGEQVRVLGCEVVGEGGGLLEVGGQGGGGEGGVLEGEGVQEGLVFEGWVQVVGSVDFGVVVSGVEFGFGWDWGKRMYVRFIE